MEYNSPRVSRKVRGGPTWKSRYAVDEGGDFIECSGKYCRSCTAGVIADCVALCCCPCAVLDLLTLALVKVPWKMGRRCLGLGKKKRKKVEMKRKCKTSCCCCSTSGGGDHQVGDGNLRERVRVEEGMWEFPTAFAEEKEEEIGNLSARLEAERVWLELYQVGHLGFGRVSFTGI
ncbi:PREDICTED: uncharacterized protein LOC18600772 [Theobroma cacao]|uniref:Uncharacterized protein LOC18600772 n=1 Tax=Theobroma cacao TaxID=3641 RepID=A0AB32V767_THECC|nr:PREDICTED: uncharacterized protein LOC18600772 [Theobroma cacao]